MPNTMPIKSMEGVYLWLPIVHLWIAYNGDKPSSTSDFANAHRFKTIDESSKFITKYANSDYNGVEFRIVEATEVRMTWNDRTEYINLRMRYEEELRELNLRYGMQP
jgi:hypothetical protein